MTLAKWVRPVCNRSPQRETQTVQHAAERGEAEGRGDRTGGETKYKVANGIGAEKKD